MLTKIRHLYDSQPGATGEPPPPPTPKESPTPPPSEAGGGNPDAHLDFYKQPAPQGTPDPKTETPPQSEPEKPAAEAKPTAIAGYDSEKEPEVVPPVEEPAAPPVPPKSVKEELGYELDLKDVDEADAKKVVEFAKTHKLPEESAKAFLEMRKAESASAKAEKDKAIADYNRKVKETKAAWHKELKEDKVFGGDKFAYNLGLVTKVLDLMPEVKEDLTKSGNMLPPNVMRGLRALGEQLFKTEETVVGDPPAGEGDKPYDPTSFYSKTY